MRGAKMQNVIEFCIANFPEMSLMRILFDPCRTNPAQLLPAGRITT
jgi:hypothetical protein